MTDKPKTLNEIRDEALKAYMHSYKGTSVEQPYLDYISSGFLAGWTVCDKLHREAAQVLVEAIEAITTNEHSHYLYMGRLTQALEEYRKSVEE